MAYTIVCMFGQSIGHAKLVYNTIFIHAILMILGDDIVGQFTDPEDHSSRNEERHVVSIL